MKKVLFITNAFPPVGGVRVQRNLKYVKYLPRHGWLPLVLTIDPQYFMFHDDQLLNEIPKAVMVYRTKCLKPKQKTFSWIKSDMNKDSDTQNTTKKIMRFIENELLITDIWITWLPFAIREGRKIIRNNDVDVIFCSGGPFSAMIIGYFLSIIFKKPLILDYRDGLILDAHRKTSKLNIIKNSIDYFLEKSVLKHSSKIIFVSDSMCKGYTKCFSSISRKSFALPNGFDSQDFLNAHLQETIKKPYGKIIISHIGSCNEPARKFLVMLFLKAMRNIILENDISNNITIKFVGVIPKDILAAIKAYGLEHIIEVINFVPHKEAIQIMTTSDALLLLIDKSPRSKDILSGKLFEYLAAQKPILALAPSDGEAGKVIIETSSGTVLDYYKDDIKTIENKIISFIKEIKTYDPAKIDQQKIKKYDRAEIARQLSLILDSSIDSSSTKQ